jgi:hypothetical protein
MVYNLWMTVTSDRVASEEAPARAPAYAGAAPVAAAE